MNALILDGSPANDATGGRVAAILAPLLAAKGYKTEHVVLRDKTLGHCRGCFQCWLKTPGVCILDDDNRELSRKFIQSDLTIFLTPVMYGAYSPELKRMLDHLIANISPFFTTIDGETHHRMRYERYPDVMVTGWSDRPDQTQEALFNHLAWRNTINFNGEKRSWGIVDRHAGDVALKSQVEDLVRKLDSSSAHQGEELPRIAAETAAAPQKAVLLVGSPRMAKSSSASLGGYLLDQLAARGVATETIQIYHAMHDEPKRQAMLDAIDRSDLTLLAFPLYIDSLPAPVLSLMRDIEARRAGKAMRGAFAAIANCGFIESSQNESALASCATFAKAAGFRWMGSITIGGGEGLVHGRQLAELGGPAIPYKKALDRVAEAFAAGKPVPEEARQQLAKPFIPGWIYRFVGSRNWKKQARQNGVFEKIDARPYQRVAG
ncbi:MAG: NADPH-dependent FMN reductase [Chlorobaculum sp.]|nr:NADPH-dependent FMN reductase [Chlorobaculum sp.]